jgi:hypothetical protein
MPRRSPKREVTSKKAASAEPEILRVSNGSKAAKSAAASALSLRPSKK